MKRNLVFFFPFLFLVGSCTTFKSNSQAVRVTFPLDSIRYWYQKDYFLDKVPGISLERWNKENKLTTKNKIIVAVLDMQIDKNHDDLKGRLWINKEEIPNNKKDDDQNGYVDDVEGWSFTGDKNGSYVQFSNHEFIRVLRAYQKDFEGIKEEDVDINKIQYFKEYLRAKKTYNDKLDYNRNWRESLIFMEKVYPIAKDSLKKYFPKEGYTIKQLDSLYLLKKINDKSFWQRRNDNDRDLGALIEYMTSALELNQNYEKIVDQKIKLDSVIDLSLNIKYNDRKEIGDDETQLEKGYGNNNISDSFSKRWKLLYHNTRVSGIIAGNRANETGVYGFSDNIVIMPVNISPMGDKHDKDIAMAIYYAVDNGAKVINMSFSKEFSLKREWVDEALRYAEKHNVLVVSSAGNNGFDIDTMPKYPTDYEHSLKKEICDNFITVGATTNLVGEKLVPAFTNYGKENVDIFAPGYKIYMANYPEAYTTESGTSYAAPMVSGTAALIWLYYPNLSVQEVKKIIFESGTSYDIEVLVPGGEGKKAPFKELSKSGKVLNVYNAMEMAKKMSKLK